MNNFISAYCTDAGAIKRINQDSLCIKSAVFCENNIIFAAVCDGLGGLSDGEAASAYIIKGLCDWFDNILPELLRENAGVLNIRQSIDKKLHTLSDNLSRYSELTGKSLGTTMTSMLFLTNTGKIITSHIGDTRIYRIKDDSTDIITNDHSVIYDEIRAGKLTEQEAENDTRQNQLTKCIGAGLKNVSYDYSISAYEENCVYMICSDGFRKKISRSEISAALSPSVITDELTAEKKLRELTDICIERNEIDNISALIIKL